VVEVSIVKMQAFILVLALVGFYSVHVAASSPSWVGGLYNSTFGGINPSTVATLDLKAFTGTWLQMASDKIVLSTFEKDAYCATATYEALPDGKISVHNYATIGSASGSVYTIDGYAYVPDASKPGQLKVHFTSTDVSHSPFDAPYWILQTGPIVNGAYDWAIVSDNLSMTLFVLARNANTYNTQYKAAVSAQLEALGFTGYKAPIDLYQGSDCKYDHPISPTATLSAEKKAGCKHSISLGGLWSGLFSSSKTVSALDIPAYMGLWYQMYGNKFVFSTTSDKNPTCATQTLTLKSDGKIAAHNFELNDKGEVSQIDGYAYQPDATKPGELKLHIDSVPVDGPYYIYSLGPIVNGLYEYAVVSDPFLVSLFILARDPVVFKEKYEADVLALVTSMGFTSSLSKPIAIPQGSQCPYQK
jgi:lipocalin